MAFIVSFFFLVIICATSQLSLAYYEGLLPNGDFEWGPQPWQLNGTQALGPDCIPDWQICGFVEYITSGHKQGDMLLVVPMGQHAVRISSNAAIHQTLTGLSKGAIYSITFSAARSCAQQEKINVSTSTEWGIFPIQTMYSSNGWDTYAWSWIAKSDRDVIIIHNPCRYEDRACGPLIDNIAIKQLTPLAKTTGNLLKNGDFEEGPYVLPNTDCGVLIPPYVMDEEQCPLRGWTVVSPKAVKYIDSDHFFVPSGRRAIELVAGRESALSQEVCTEPGHSYALRFLVGDANNACVGSMLVEACAGASTIEVAYDSKGTGGYRWAELRFNATETHTRIVFFSKKYHTRNDDFCSLCGPVVDDVLLLPLK